MNAKVYQIVRIFVSTTIDPTSLRGLPMIPISRCNLGFQGSFLFFAT